MKTSAIPIKSNSITAMLILLCTILTSNIMGQSTVKAMFTPPIVDKDRVPTTSFHNYPAKLLAFDASPGNGATEISWQTSYEEKLKKFVVEYSEDNIVFKPVGEVPAKNTISGARYSFRHVVTNPDRNIYYRLMAVNATGRIAYSQPQPMLVSGNGRNYVFPTMISNHTVSLYLNEPFETAEIVTMEGRMVRKQMIGDQTGRIDIVVPATVTGACVVRVHHRDTSKSIVKKVILQ